MRLAQIPKSRRVAGLVLAIGMAIAASGAVRLDDPVSIKWRPVVGSKAKYRFTNRHGGDGVSKMTVTWTNHATVSKIENGRVWVQNANEDIAVTVDGQPSSAEISIGNFRHRYTFLGDVVGGDDAEGFGFMFSIFGGFRFPDRPLKVGEEWKGTAVASGGKGRAEVKVTYRAAEELNSVKCFRFDYDFKTTADGIGTHGTVWVSAETGNLVKRTSTLKNVDFGGGPETMTQEVEAIG